MKKILSVIVTYNRLPMLKKTMAAVVSQEAECDVLLVNNAGTDGTEEWALSEAKKNAEENGRRFFYENTGANIGGAGGFQYGMRRGMELGYDHVWIMDDDAVPKPDTLQTLLKADAELKKEDGSPSYGFLSSVVRWTDGSLCEMNRQRLPSHYVQEEDIKEALRKGERLPADSATFVSLLFPKETIFFAGLPIKEFFIWSDDVEYTSRVTQRCHLPSWIVPESEIIHETKNNVGSDIVSDEAARIDRYFFAYRNGFYACRRYSARMFFSFLYHTFLTFFRIFAKAKDHKGKRARTLLKGFFRGIVFHPAVEYVKPEDASSGS